MSLYELETMWRNMNSAANEPSDEEWEEAQDIWAEATAAMPDVRL